MQKGLLILGIVIAWTFYSCKKEKKEDANLYPAVAEVDLMGNGKSEIAAFDEFPNGKFLIATKSVMQSGSTEFKLGHLDETKTEPVEPRTTFISVLGNNVTAGGAYSPAISRFVYIKSEYLFGVSALQIGSITDFGGHITSARNYLTGHIKVSGIKVFSNGYLVVGSVDSNGTDAFIAWYSPSFGFQWSKTYGGNGYDVAMDAVQLCDGNIGLLCLTNSIGAGDRDIWYLKLDNNGDMITATTHGGAGYEEPHQIIIDDNCRLYIASHSASFGNPEHDGYLLCINSDGSKVWDKTYGTPMHDGFNALTFLPGQTGIIAAGRSMQGHNPGSQEDLYIQAVDLNGKELWRRTYGHPEETEIPFKIIARGNHYYLACNRYHISGGVKSIFVKDLLP